MKKISCFILLTALLFSSCQAAPTVAPTTEATLAPTALPTVEPPPPTPTSQPSEPEGVIAFYADWEGGPDVYTLHADGTRLTRLTDDPASDDSPAISPDGKHIAFLTARHDPAPRSPNFKYELYAMDIDGGNQKRLTTTEAAEDHPAWSPDGSRIIFDADYDADGFYEIYTIQPDGSNLITRLTSNAANDQFADWSPDGRYIAFSSDRNGNWDIYVMNTDGSDQRPLTNSANWELFPAWSPDGTLIAFNTLVPRSRDTDIFVMNANGSDVRQLTDTPRFDENPAWSPDGKQIAFQTERDGNFEIYIMNADGTDQHPLASHSRGELWPSWGVLNAPTISFRKSDQQFDARETFQAGLGDLDADGGLDAVRANPQENASQVWLNDGSGLLVNIEQKLTQYGHGIGLADFDENGDLDALVTNGFRSTGSFPSRLFLNDGSGRFTDSGQSLNPTLGAEPSVGDLDLDGDLDVFIANISLPDEVWLTDGNGHFTDGGLRLEGNNSAKPSLGDLDGDGDLDVLVGGPGFKPLIWLNLTIE